MNNKDRESTGVHRQYQEALNEGKFQIQYCNACSKSIFFPREVCPHCGSTALQWKVPSGLGTVHAVTTVRRKPEAGGDYNVSLIDLDEGVRMMSRVEGESLEAITIGMRVKAKVVTRNGAGLVVFFRFNQSGATA